MTSSSSGRFDYICSKILPWPFMKICVTYSLHFAKPDAKKLCVILKCIGGAHIGQRFILEPNSVIFIILKLSTTTKQ